MLLTQHILNNDDEYKKIKPDIGIFFLCWRSSKSNVESYCRQTIFKRVL